jgi:hypothetical protein
MDPKKAFGIFYTFATNLRLLFAENVKKAKNQPTLLFIVFAAQEHYVWYTMLSAYRTCVIQNKHS